MNIMKMSTGRCVSFRWGHHMTDAFTDSFLNIVGKIVSDRFCLKMSGKS